MRFVLLPIEILEWCEFREAVDWAQSRIYPLGDEFMGAQENAIGADFGGPDDYGPQWRQLREPAREQLLARLITGQIPARGRFYDGIGESELVGADSQEALMQIIAGRSSVRLEIPSDAWSDKALDRHGQVLRTPAGIYTEIAIPTEPLLRCFPESPRSEVTVAKSGSVFLWEDECTKSQRVNRGGRPPSYNWPVFHAEIVRIIREEGDLPATQAMLERRMADWCSLNWGDEPATSVLRQHISPLYKSAKSARKNDKL